MYTAYFVGGEADGRCMQLSNPPAVYVIPLLRRDTYTYVTNALDPIYRRGPGDEVTSINYYPVVCCEDSRVVVYARNNRLGELLLGLVQQRHINSPAAIQIPEEQQPAKESTVKHGTTKRMFVFGRKTKSNKLST